jgi:hypothetical protein
MQSGVENAPSPLREAVSKLKNMEPRVAVAVKDRPVSAKEQAFAQGPNAGLKSLFS